VMIAFGLRRTMLGAMALLAAAVGASTFMRAPWQLVLLWGAAVGVGTGLAAMVLGATVVNRWFVERRGLALGLLTASTATGQLVFLPLLARVVQGAGWRAAVLVVAGAAVLVLPLVALLMRDDPRDVGLAPYGGTAADAVVTRPSRNPAALALSALARAARTRDFWLLAGTFFICGASTNGLVGTHLIPAAHDHGIPEVRAAGLLAMMGIFDFIGTTLSGWLSDRYDNRWLLAWYYGLRGLSLLFLPGALVSASAVSLGVFAVFYGLDWIATVPPTVRLASDAFGKAEAPVIFGWIGAAHQLGAASIALAAGTVRDTLGDYRPAFLFSGALCAVAATLALRVRGARGRPRGAEPIPVPVSS
jgi:sugar phosphate permease